MKLLTRIIEPVEADEPAHRWSTITSPSAFGDVRLKSFSRLADKVVEREQGKEDIIVPFADIKFVTDMGAIDIRSHGRVLMSDLAFTQLCTRLKIPSDYMVRCPLDLRNANLSYWVEQNDERKIMLRIRKFPEKQQDTEGMGVLRAVLPQTYEPIDNERILDWCGAAIDHFNGTLGIQSYKVAEGSTHIRMLFEEPTDVTETDDGGADPFYFGVHVSDSEVGERGFSADMLSFRPVTEVGFLHLLDGSHLVTQRHIHIDFKLLRKNFADSFDVAKENIESIEEMLSRARGVPIKDAHSYIRRLVRHHRLTNDFAETVIHAYDSEPVPSKLGVAFSIARAATGLPVDDRVNTEALVGSYLLEGA
jgi:hypothetical protein